MKKIINTFKRAKANNQRPPLSFEIFPPKGVLTNDAARETASKLVDLHPDFVSVTYSAGGSKNSNATSEIAAILQDELDMTAMAHLTCSSASEEKITAAPGRPAGKRHRKRASPPRRPYRRPNPQHTLPPCYRPYPSFEGARLLRGRRLPTPKHTPP